MGTYYTKEQFELGIPARDNKTILSGCKLVMMLDRGTRTIYPDVTNPDEFSHFLQQYKTGLWLDYKVHMVRESLLNK